MARIRFSKSGYSGLTNSEGNHGGGCEGVLLLPRQSTPTHSYMKYLYKYPQVAYPYADLVRDEPTSNERMIWSMNSSTPVCLQRRPILRRLRGICQGRSREDILVRNHRSQPWTGAGRNCTFLPTLWVPERTGRRGLPNRIELLRNQTSRQILGSTGTSAVVGYAFAAGAN